MNVISARMAVGRGGYVRAYMVVMRLGNAQNVSWTLTCPVRCCCPDFKFPSGKCYVIAGLTKKGP